MLTLCEKYIYFFFTALALDGENEKRKKSAHPTENDIK
jgi:hypothetical protein